MKTLGKGLSILETVGLVGGTIIAALGVWYAVAFREPQVLVMGVFGGFAIVGVSFLPRALRSFGPTAK